MIWKELKKTAVSIILAVVGTFIVGYVFFRPGVLPLMLYALWMALGHLLSEQGFIKLGYTIIAIAVFYVLTAFYLKLIENKSYRTILVAFIPFVIIFFSQLYVDFEVQICHWWYNEEILLKAQQAQLPPVHPVTSSDISNYIRESKKFATVLIDTIIYNSKGDKFVSLNAYSDNNTDFSNYCVIGVWSNQKWIFAKGYDGLSMTGLKEEVFAAARKEIFNRYCFYESKCRKTYWSDDYTFKKSFPDVES